MIRTALIIDNVDPDKKGKIKGRIYPEMEEYQEDVLPWMRPVYKSESGQSKTELIKHAVPEIGTFVVVEVSEDWTSFEYSQELVYIASAYDYDTLISEIGDVITELETQTYPQPRMEKFADGSIHFHNTDTGEHGVVYSGSNYFYSNSLNDVSLKNESLVIKYTESTKKLEFTGMTSFEVDGDRDNAVMWSALNTFLGLVINHTHSFYYISGVAPYALLETLGTSEKSSTFSGGDNRSDMKSAILKIDS